MSSNNRILWRNLQNVCLKLPSFLVSYVEGLEGVKRGKDNTAVPHRDGTVIPTSQMVSCFDMTAAGATAARPSFCTQHMLVKCVLATEATLPSEMLQALREETADNPLMPLKQHSFPRLQQQPQLSCSGTRAHQAPDPPLLAGSSKIP